jgi:hypothetical protein
VRELGNFAPWQVVVLTLLSSYVSNRLLLLLGLNRKHFILHIRVELLNIVRST